MVLQDMWQALEETKLRLIQASLVKLGLGLSLAEVYIRILAPQDKCCKSFDEDKACIQLLMLNWIQLVDKSTAVSM